MSTSPTPSSGRAPKSAALNDVARGLAMIVVLYGHALEIFFLRRPDGAVLPLALLQYKVMASFAMPLFFLVSGAAAAKLAEKGWRNVLKTSLFMLVLAYGVHVLGLAPLAVQQTLGGGPDIDLLAYGIESMLKGRNFSTIVVWFLVSLAIVRMIAYILLRSTPPRALFALVCLLALASLIVPYLPQLFMLRTWFAGLVFFISGMALAGSFQRLPVWLGPALLPLVAWLALANRGCPYDPLARCPQVQLATESVVWLHAGDVGFIPLFYLTALAGSIMVLALARGLVANRLGQAVARIGRKTLDLLVLNGFVLVFLQPWLKLVPMGTPGLWIYPALLAGVIVLHLVLLRLLETPLAGLHRVCARIADRLAGLLVVSDKPKQSQKSSKPVVDQTAQI